MITRSIDPNTLAETLSLFPEMVDESFDPRAWMAEYANIALESDGNFGLFEYVSPGVYEGHYFFATARGNAAFDLSRSMLTDIFERDAEAIKGLTPVGKKGATWLTRRLGFKDCGVVDIDRAGPCHLFILTKGDFL